MISLIKRLLPTRAKRLLRAFINLPVIYLPSLIHKSDFFSGLYYLFFKRSFSREQKAVLAGRVAYKKSLKELGRSSVLLRRNIHRLEKGLIMEPRRDVFAEDYIFETVDTFVRAVNKGDLCSYEKKWCNDVLKEYFYVVQHTSIVARAKKVFESIEIQDHSESYIPYQYSHLPEHDISFDELNKLFLRRRSVRWYQQKDIPTELIKKAIDIASLAPSACNRQPYMFYVSSNHEKAVEMAKCAGGTVGFAENLPCLIALIGDLSAYPEERDRHLIYIDGGLVAMQLMLALETLGLASCPINWPDVEIAELKMQKLLGLESYQRVVMLIATGYAQSEGGIAYSQKKNANFLMKRV